MPHTTTPDTAPREEGVRTRSTAPREGVAYPDMENHSPSAEEKEGKIDMQNEGGGGAIDHVEGEELTEAVDLQKDVGYDVNVRPGIRIADEQGLDRPL